MSSLVFLSDEIRDILGMPYTIMLVSRYLIMHNYKIYIVSTYISDKVKSEFQRYGIMPISISNTPLIKVYEMSYLIRFALETLLRYNSAKVKNILEKIPEEKYVILNFSNYFLTKSHVWYGGGAITDLIEDLDITMLSNIYIKSIIKNYVRVFDNIFLSNINVLSNVKCFVSKYIANSYSKFGLQSNCVIYPPIDTEFFRPVESPSADYVLTYFGKETDYKAIKHMLDIGIKIIAYGGKGVKYAPRAVLEHKNLVFLGYVVPEKLRELYANALYTAFPFTSEPFGYVPVESMACGTPVLTYNKQGPKETVIDGITGWLASNRDEFLRIARKIWQRKYDKSLRLKARKHGELFDYRRVGAKWKAVISVIESRALSKI